MSDYGGVKVAFWSSWCRACCQCVRYLRSPLSRRPPASGLETTGTFTRCFPASSVRGARSRRAWRIRSDDFCNVGRWDSPKLFLGRSAPLNPEGCPLSSTPEEIEPAVAKSFGGIRPEVVGDRVDIAVDEDLAGIHAKIIWLPLHIAAFHSQISALGHSLFLKMRPAASCGASALKTSGRLLGGGRGKGCRRGDCGHVGEEVGRAAIFALLRCRTFSCRWR